MLRVYAWSLPEAKIMAHFRWSMVLSSLVLDAGAKQRRPHDYAGSSQIGNLLRRLLRITVFSLDRSVQQ